MLKHLIYQPTVNKVVRMFLKPLSGLLPGKWKFPVSGTFVVKGAGVPQFRMVTNPTNAVTKFLFWGDIEGFEYNAVRVFLGLLKDSKVFFDIGSNIGYYSLLASSVKNRQIDVYAFEPMPSIYDYLVRNAELNGFNNVKAFRLALSNEKGTAEFYSIKNEKFKDLPQLTGDGSLNSSHSSSLKVKFDVETDTLDNFVASRNHGLKIDLIKLDTEANEHRVLAGAHLVLSEHRPVIQCEILKNQIEKELQQILDKYSYLYFLATNKGLVEVQSFSNNSTPFNDYYLVPSEKRNAVSKFILERP